MESSVIISRLNAIKSNPISMDEWLDVVDRLFDTKTYPQFRKERYAELKGSGIPYKEILSIISNEWKEYKIKNKA